MLLEMGHEVERRKVLIGEKLWDKYDFAFLGVAPLSSLTSGRVPETHYAMDMMRGRHVVYADDWSFYKYGASVRYTLEKWEKYVKYKNFPYDSEVIESTKTHLSQMMDFNEKHNATVLAPMFPWGNHRFLMTGGNSEGNYKARLVTVDPSAWMKYPSLDIGSPLDRKRQWVMAALSDHTPWINKQHFRMPVKYIGNKRMPKVEVLTERQTVKLFSESYGVLSAGYPSAGSGWWRTRYLNAAWAESIVYCDPIDQATMGAPYQGDSEHFESFTSEKRYEQLAQEQADWLLRNISTKDTGFTILERLMAK